MTGRARLALAGAALLGLGLAALRVEPQTDPTQLLHTPAAEALDAASRAFGLDQRAHLLVEVADDGRGQDLLRFAAALRERLAPDPRYGAVEDGLAVDPEQAARALVLPWGPLYWSPERLPALSERLTRAGMQAQLRRQLERLGLAGLGELERWIEVDPLELGAPLRARVQTLQGSYAFAPGRHHLSRDGRALLVTVAIPAAGHPVGPLDAAVEAILREPWAAGLRVSAAGGPYLARESQAVIQGDLVRSGFSALPLALLLLAALLRLRLDRMALLFLPTAWGTLVGVGLFAALHPRLSVLALACTPVVVGLGIDFTIHLIAAARAHRGQGRDPQQAAQAAAREMRAPLLVAAATSAAAFLSFLGAEQGFLQEMGLLTALGLACALLGALWLLPPLLARVLLADAVGGPAGVEVRDAGASRLAGWSWAHPRLALGGAGLLAAAAATLVALDPPRLEDDLRRIHARDSRPLAAQERIATTFGGTREPVLLLLEGPDEAAVMSACQALDPELLRLVDEGTLAARLSPAALLPPRAAQEQVLAWARAQDGARLRADLLASLDEVGFDPAALSGYADALARLPGLAGPLDPAGLRALGLGPLLRDVLHVEPDGRAAALVLCYPREEPWSAAARQALAGALREALRRSGLEAQPGVAARLTGLHLVSAEAARQVAGDFQRVSLLTAGAVLAVLLVRFRSARLAGLVLLPAGLGVVWTAGLYALFDLRLNLMNLGVLPMVLALGVDDGIVIVHRALAGESIRGPAFRATAAGVLLTTLTTTLAFGGLAFSHNRGIASVGVLSAAGMAFCLLASLAVLPAALRVAGAARSTEDA